MYRGSTLDAMRQRRNPLAVLVGGALIVLGVAPLLNITLPLTGFALLIAAGALLLGLRTKAIGTVALAVWLAVQGVLLLITIDIPQIGTIQSVLAILAGILILVDR